MPDKSGLDVDIRHRLGTLDLNVLFTTSAQWTVLFGPSGSGKSTILRLIAGLETPHEGAIAIGGQTVFDSRQRTNLPAHQRGMRWNSQRTMLFPHKTVRWNLVMGMDGRDAELEQAIEHFGLADLADRMPDELSGGQRQLVAVARAAIGSRGRLLLLDEPFSGLDANVRDALIANLRRWRGDSPTLSVTHDVGEAFLLAGDAIRIADGCVVARGPVGEVLADERRRLLGVLG